MAISSTKKTVAATKATAASAAVPPSSEVSPFVKRFIKYTSLDAKDLPKAYPVITTYPASVASELLARDARIWLDDTGVLMYGSIADCRADRIRIVANPLTGDREPTAACNTPPKGWTPSRPYLFSQPNGMYLLYTDGTKVSLRYNVVPRPDFVQYLRGKGHNDTSVLESMCAMTGGLDPVCQCMNNENPFEKGNPNTNKESLRWARDGQASYGEDTEWCLNTIMGGREMRRVYKEGGGYGPDYKGALSTCGCVNTECLKTHPVMPILHPGGCDAVALTLCGQKITVNGDVSGSNLSLQQHCSSSIVKPLDGRSGDPKNTQAPTMPAPAPTLPPESGSLPSWMVWGLCLLAVAGLYRMWVSYQSSQARKMEAQLLLLQQPRPYYYPAVYNRS